ncbi:oxygenase MpaB family protein [Fulvivirga lutea]|uniref:DUF2236 domain-containing protein n=1 Tax=Fulvivirga lutea TaxID=2810512 RepID=A0A974WGB1_9BACT|nr:oxygenase MpaB family protein [Fulvivirga lutea]QSE96637.1 DUF2236 domain-containing protein [Fulvivirga lutea]
MSQTFDISKITTVKLDELRYVTDPLADNTVKNIIESGFEKQVNEVFKTLVSESSITKSSFNKFDQQLQDILNDYIDESAKLPDWADQELIEKGEEVFSLYGPEIFMLLNVSSLPMCYTCGKGALVLYDTGRLLTHNGNVHPLARRLMETAQMIVNVMSEGGLKQSGQGIITIQKIRLIHASIRYFLKTKGYNGAPWDVQENGEPINQEDLAGTLMSFAPVILNGLEHLGISLSDEQKNAYMHSWKVVGYLMGIKEELLPSTFDEGFSLASRILQHQAIPSEAGKALTQACIDFINHTIPGNAFHELPSYLMATFLDDFSKASNKDLAEYIGVSKSDEKQGRIAMAISKFISKGIGQLEHHLFIQKVSKSFNKLLMQGIIHHFNGGKEVNFYIPPSLRKNWNLENEWEDSRSLLTIGENRIALQRKKQNI